MEEIQINYFPLLLMDWKVLARDNLETNLLFQIKTNQALRFLVKNAVTKTDPERLFKCLDFEFFHFFLKLIIIACI